jgi:HEAT repeat protein
MPPTNFVEDLRQRVLARLDPIARSKAEADFTRLERLKVTSLSDLLRLAHGDCPSIDDQLAAIWLLGQAGKWEGLAPLTALLGSAHDPRHYWEIAKALVSAEPSRRSELSQSLLTALANTTDAQKLCALVYAIGLLGEDGSVPALSEILLSHRAPTDVRVHAAEALGNIASLTASAALETSLDRQPLGVTTAAIRSLASVPNALSADVLRELLASATELLNELRAADMELRLRDESASRDDSQPGS